MKIITYIIVVLLFFGFISDKKESKKEQIANALVKVKEAYNTKKVEDGMIPLQEIIQSDTILPNEVAFFTGAFLVHYQKYSKAENALLRYLKITKKEGDYYQESLQLLQEIWQQKKIDTCQLCTSTPVLSAVLDCQKCVKTSAKIQKLIEEECLANGMALCETCKGEGIITRTGSMGNLMYQTCPKCHGEGYVPCPYLQKK